MRHRALSIFEFQMLLVVTVVSLLADFRIWARPEFDRVPILAARCPAELRQSGSKATEATIQKRTYVDQLGIAIAPWTITSDFQGTADILVARR